MRHEVSAPGDNGLSGRKVRKVGEMPSTGIRRVSTKWESENPFKLLRSLGMKTEDEFETISQKDFQESQDESAEKPDEDSTGGETLIRTVAPMSLSDPRRGWRSSASAWWIHSDSHSHPYRHQDQSLQALRESMCASAPLARMGIQAGEISESSKRTSGSSSDVSVPVVVARAECELSHPIPSRSSETKMLRVLVTEKDKKSEEPREQGKHLSQESESMGSLTSFHTARQGVSDG